MSCRSWPWEENIVYSWPGRTTSSTAGLACAHAYMHQLANATQTHTSIIQDLHDMNIHGCCIHASASCPGRFHPDMWVFQTLLCAEMMMTMDDDNAFSFCTLKLVDVTTQGPRGGTSQGVSLLSGSFSAMKSPVGFHGAKEPATVIHSSTRGQPA